VPLANWLAKRAHELGRSRSDLVRQALEEQRQRKNSRGEKSCAELMADFGGFFGGRAIYPLTRNSCAISGSETDVDR
jgi:hypothetical protein